MFQRKLNSMYNLQPTTKSQHLILCFIQVRATDLGGGKSCNLLKFMLLLRFTKYT